MFVQVLGSTVFVVPAVLSRSVAVAQSHVTESVHTTRYQKVKVVTPAGAVNVWLTELSPLNAPVLPTRADAAPLWATVDVAVLPALVHAVRPDSKPPLVSPAGGGGNVALMLTSS